MPDNRALPQRISVGWLRRPPLRSARGGVSAPAYICYRDAVMADGPTFALPMSESSGNLSDIVAGKTATVTGTPTYGVSGPVLGYTAIRFTAGTQFFSVADHPDLDCGDQGSWEFWGARDADTAAFQIAFNKGTNAYSVGLADATGDARDDSLNLGKTGVASLFYGNSNVAPDSAWHHHMVTRYSAGLAAYTRVYLDGVEDTTQTFDAATVLLDTALALEIGREGASQGWRGPLAWLAVYKHPLSAARVAAHFAAATVPCDVALLAGALSRYDITDDLDETA